MSLNLFRQRRTQAIFIAGSMFYNLQTVKPQSKAIQSAVTVPAEKSSTPLPEFEVATIKPISPGGTHMYDLRVYPGGRVKIQTYSFKALICTAFNLSWWQVSGGDSMDKQAYDVEAKPSETVSSSPFYPEHARSGIQDERLREMLQTLLIDRFHLKFHRETKVSTIYLLELSGKTITLQPTKASSDSVYPSGEVDAVGGKGWSLYQTSMKQLAKFLSDIVLHQAVIDQTGLSQSFDFHSKNILTNEDIRDPEISSTLLPVIKEMGLKLVSAKGPVETFVIDDAEPPTPN